MYPHSCFLILRVKKVCVSKSHISTTDARWPWVTAECPPVLTTDLWPRCPLCSLEGPGRVSDGPFNVSRNLLPGAALSKLARSSWPHLIQTTGFGLLLGKITALALHIDMEKGFVQMWTSTQTRRKYFVSLTKYDRECCRQVCAVQTDGQTHNVTPWAPDRAKNVIWDDC